MNRQVKEITKEDPRTVCMYCNKSEINSLEWGPMYNLAGVTVHYFCMLFSAGLSQNGDDDEGILGFLPIDIRKELKRGDKLKCKFCKAPRATIGCSVRNCKMSYHYPCGLEKKCVFHFIGNFESYCAQHKEPVSIPLSRAEWDCPICYNPVKDEDLPLWPPCCKKRVFHKRCIMEMAKNHGAHFFKCPLCNDRDIFSVAMKRSGVYVPDRDASWETGDAYADHAVLYNKCDADPCQCPKGPEYSSKSESKPWKVIRCGACGASAIHRRCGNLKNLTWRCPTCSDILSEKRKNESMMNSSRIQRHQYDLSDDEEVEEEENIIGVKEAITEAPEVYSSTSRDSSSEDDRREVQVYVDRYRRAVLPDVLSSDSSSEDEDDSDDSPDPVFIQANSRLRQKLESSTLVSEASSSVRMAKKSKISGLVRSVLKNMNGIQRDVICTRERSDIVSSRQNYVESSIALHDDCNEWRRIRNSTFDAKLSNVIVKCCRQSSSTTTAGSSEGQLTADSVSNPVRTDYSPGNVVSLPPLGRDILIKVDGRKKIEGQVLLQPKPDVLNESPSGRVKISLKGRLNLDNTTTSTLLNSRKQSTAEVNECEEAETKTPTQCAPIDDNADDVVIVNNQTVSKSEKETCITLDDDDDSDIEILSAKVKPIPCTKTTAFLEMVNRVKGRKPATTGPVVRLGVDDDQNDDIEFVDSVDHPKPTITFSSFRQPAVGLPSISAAFLRVINTSKEPSSSRSQFSGRLSSVLRNNMKSGSNRDVETVELISDEEDPATSDKLVSDDQDTTASKGELKSATKCSKKRERLSPSDGTVTQSTGHSKRQRT